MLKLPPLPVMLGAGVAVVYFLAVVLTTLHKSVVLDKTPLNSDPKPNPNL